MPANDNDSTEHRKEDMSETIEQQANDDLAGRLTHDCQPTCTPENCDAQQAAKRLRSYREPMNDEQINTGANHYSIDRAGLHHPDRDKLAVAFFGGAKWLQEYDGFPPRTRWRNVT